MTELPPEMRLSSDPKDNMKKRTFSMKGMKVRAMFFPIVQVVF